MSKVYFTSDLHLGHQNIKYFDAQNTNVRGGTDSESHDEWLIEEINKVVKKRDIIWILGDIAMGKQGTVDKRGIGWYNISKVGRLNGTKKAILGNHDDMTIDVYQQYFQVMRGMFRYKQHWLTHAPMHPTELRGKVNIHGHTHSNEMMDSDDVDTRYLNVCVEANMKYHGSPVVEFSELISRFK